MSRGLLSVLPSQSRPRELLVVAADGVHGPTDIERDVSYAANLAPGCSPATTNYQGRARGAPSNASLCYITSGRLAAYSVMVPTGVAISSRRSTASKPAAAMRAGNAPRTLSLVVSKPSRS